MASIGSLKFAHHLGLTRFSNLGEQLTLQESVTHSINMVSSLSFAPLETADLAAGVRLRGATCLAGGASAIGSRFMGAAVIGSAGSVNLPLPEHPTKERTRIDANSFFTGALYCLI